MTLPPDVNQLLGQELTNALGEIRRRAKNAVERETLVHFTDHTVNHLDQVAANFVNLAKSSMLTKYKLNPFEYFVGLAASYLHDVALQETIRSKKTVTRLEAYDQVIQRNNHGIAAQNWIIREIEESEPPPPPLGTDYNETVKKLCRVAAPLCRFHCSDPPKEPLQNKKLLEHEIRCQLLLGILRLADALHLDFKRVQMDLLRQHKIPVDSELHWWRHHYTDSVTIDETATIEITMSFPKLSKPEQDFFKGSTYDYINDELQKFKPVFRENGVTADLLPIATDDGWGPAKLPPSDELRKWMDAGQLLQDAGSKSNPAPKTKPGRKRSLSFAYTQWSVEGHPWVDLPASWTSQEFVETASLRSYLDSVGEFIAGKSGDMRMVYGGRGVGKTTFLYSVRDRFNEVADVIYLDMSIVFGALDSVSKLYTWLFGNLVRELGDVGPKPAPEDVPNRLREAAKQHERPLVILIDNLDRYVKEPDMATIKRFFEISQGPLQELKERATILVTAHEDWQGFVKEEDLSYIGAAPSWTLEPMTAEEIRELLHKRLQISGSSYEKVFSSNAYSQIHRIAGGNPRLAIGDCAFLFESAIRQRASLINEEFIRSYNETDLNHRLYGLVHEARKNFPIVDKVLDGFSGFHGAVEQSPHSQDYAWELLENIFASGSVPLNNIPEDIRPAFSLVAQMKSEGSSLIWIPSKPVVRALEILSKKGISREEFFGHFKSRPIKPADPSSSIYIPRSTPQIPKEYSYIKDLAEQAYASFEAQDNRREQVQFLRFWTEYWLLLLVKILGATLPSDYEEHAQGVSIVNGRKVWKFAWKHRRDFRNLIGTLRRHNIHFHTLPSMVLIDSNSRSVLEDNSTMPSPDEVSLIHLAGKQIYGEACIRLQEK